MIEAAAFPRLQGLFRELRLHRVPERDMEPSNELTAEHLSRVLAALKKPMEEARSIGAFADPWSVAGLNRDEVRTARVLSWLLHPAGSHGAGDAFVQSLWQEAKGLICFGFEPIGVVSAVTENRPMGDNLNRIDIAVEATNCLIFVEVKIDAPMGHKQLERYADAAALKARLHGKNKWAVLYISIIEEKMPLGCIQLNWKEVSSAIYRSAKQLSPNSFTKRLALLFAEYLERLN